MKTKTFLLAATLLLLGCNNPSSKTNAQSSSVNYENYYNVQNDYGVDYPDFLIPQGEADNQDGQKFIAEDGINQMWVYYDAKMDIETGDLPTIEEAFKEDLQGKNVTAKKLYDNYYTIAGKLEGDKLFEQYTISEMGSYFTMWFEFDKKDADLFDEIIKHVTESFNVGIGEGSDGFSMEFLHEFLNDCFWNKNFNTLLRNNDSKLSKYIDPKMDIIRYFNPGAISMLYRRSDNFGFDNYSDFAFEPMVAGALNLSYLSDDQSPCEISFSDEQGTALFYQMAENLPDEMVNTETYETKPVKTPYANAQIIIVYLPDSFGNPRGFYFVETPNGWKLVAVDDSLCSA